MAIMNMDLSIDWPSSSLHISPDCHDTVASTTSSSLNNNYATAAAVAGGGVIPSSVTSSKSTKSHNRHTTPRLSWQQQSALQEKRRILTEEVIRLKFNIATQRGRQDELQLDWQKLIAERNAMQLEMENIEQECENLQTETTKTKERISESNLRLHQLTSTISPEQQMIDQVTNDHTAMNSEIQSLQQEKLSIQDASKNLSDEIEECKRHAAQLSSEISEIDIERIAIQFDIDDLHEAISKVKGSIREVKSTTNKLDIDISCIKAECVKLGKHNRGLEMKVCAGSTTGRTSNHGETK
jgi:chromosome segregation ATPase